MNFHVARVLGATAPTTGTQVGNQAGVEYSLDMRLVGKEFGTYYWQVTVKDRVGNSFTTDGDEDEPGNQPYKFTIDNAGPIVDPGSGSSRTGARTGVSYEPGVGEKADRAWIALSFINYDHEGGPDRIDAATVDPGDFTVGGHTVIQTLVPSEKKCENAAGKTGKDLVGLEEACLSSPGSRIYLQLSADLASDERPTIQVLGGAFKDVAGNNNITDSFRAKSTRSRRASPSPSPAAPARPTARPPTTTAPSPSASPRTRTSAGSRASTSPPSRARPPSTRTGRRAAPPTSRSLRSPRSTR